MPTVRINRERLAPVLIAAFQVEISRVCQAVPGIGNRSPRGARVKPDIHGIGALHQLLGLALEALG